MKRATEEELVCISGLSAEKRYDYFVKRTLFPWLEPNDPKLFKSPWELMDEQLSLDDSWINEEQKYQLKNVIFDNINAMSLYDQVGKCPDWHAVTVQVEEGSKPFIKRPYPCPPHHEQYMKQILTKLCQLGILVKHEPIFMSSPIFLVKKPGAKGEKKETVASFRPVTDLRMVNKHIKANKVPAVTFPELIRRISSTSCGAISALDLSSAYYSIPLSENSKQYFGISAPGMTGIALARIPMGAINSASNLQKIMESLIAELQIPLSQGFTATYVDDIFVISRDFSTHCQHLDMIFRKVLENGFLFNCAKS